MSTTHRQFGRDHAHPGFVRSVAAEQHAAPYELWGSALAASTFVGSGQNTGPMTWPGGVPDNETCFILISFTNTDAVPLLSVVSSDLGTARQSSGGDWHTEFYGTTFSSSPSTLSINFGVSTDYIVTLAHGGALSLFDFATLQANASGTSADNAGGTVVDATALIFIAHRKGVDTSWTEPAGFIDNGESDSSPFEAHEAFLVAPGAGATGAISATMGAAAKSATVLIAAG